MIRRAKHKDIPKIFDLLLQVGELHHSGRPDIFSGGSTKYTSEQLMAKIEDGSSPIFVAVDDSDEVVGYAFCVFLETKDDNILCDRRTLYVDDLCVDCSKRGAGIGGKLYSHVKRFAADSGCDSVTLNVWACNPSAMRFYEKCGLSVQKYCMEEVL